MTPRSDLRVAAINPGESGDIPDVQLIQQDDGRWGIHCGFRALTTDELSAALQVAEAWLKATGAEAAIAIQPADGPTLKYPYGGGEPLVGEWHGSTTRANAAEPEKRPAFDAEHEPPERNAGLPTV